jgi:hypothetical protein
MPETLAQFIRSAGIDFDVVPAHDNPNMPDSEGMQHFAATLKLEERRMVVPFSGGLLAFARNVSGMPTLADVLECLRSDSYSAEESFEDWCGDYGYDEDSRKAYATWETVRTQAAELREFLGGALFARLLETEYADA